MAEPGRRLRLMPAPSSRLRPRCRRVAAILDAVFVDDAAGRPVRLAQEADSVAVVVLLVNRLRTLRCRTRSSATLVSEIGRGGRACYPADGSRPLSDHRRRTEATSHLASGLLRRPRRRTPRLAARLGHPAISCDSGAQCSAAAQRYARRIRAHPPLPCRSRDGSSRKATSRRSRPQPAPNTRALRHTAGATFPSHGHRLLTVLPDRGSILKRRSHGRAAGLDPSRRRWRRRARGVSPARRG